MISYCGFDLHSLIVTTAQNTQRDSQELSREEKWEGGDRGDLGEKKQSKRGESTQATNHTPK